MDNKEKFEIVVATTLQRYIYMNDLLKSVKDENKAIELLHYAIRMYASGGFRSTKIISNRVKVLQSVPE